MFEFDAATEIRVESSKPDELWCNALISDQWNLGATPEGGYLFALLLKSIAVFFEGKHPHPFTATASFLSKPAHGACQFRVTLLKSGTNYSTAQSVLLQRGEIKLQMVATFTDLAKRSGPTVIDGVIPKMPPVEDCPLMDEFNTKKSFNLSFHQRVEVRRNPEKPTREQAKKKAKLEGYIRLKDGREPDLMVVGMLADSFRPPVINYGSEVLGTAWFATMELSVHFRNVPAPGWLRFAFQTRHLISGSHEVDAELWDSTGKLVAMGRQMAVVLPWSRNDKKAPKEGVPEAKL